MPRTRPFEEFADDYDAWFEKNRFAYLSELEAVRRALGKPGCGLEVGVGTGRFAAPLGIRMGVEPAVRAAAIARTRGIQVLAGTAEALPFAEARFDSVLMVTTICFVDDLAQALREAWRVLKPGGKLVIGFVEADSPLGREYQRRAVQSHFYAEATFRTYEELASQLAEAGFANLRCWQTLFWSPEERAGPDKVKEGQGEGSFIVVRALKPV